MTNNYSAENIATMELIYGVGYLSGGGDDEVRDIISNRALENSCVLDLGCGLGGASIAIGKYGSPRQVIGADIDAGVLARAQQLVIENELADIISLQEVVPGPLPYVDAQFDAVYATAVTCHFEELQPMFSEIYRVLKPGGVFLGCEWIKMNNDAPFQIWDRLLRERGLNFWFVENKTFRSALESCGFHNVELRDRSAHFTQISSDALRRVEGELAPEIRRLLGDSGYQGCLEWTRSRAEAYLNGGVGQTQFFAYKPEKLV